MVMLNDLDRFHLVIDVIDRVPDLGSRYACLRQQMVDKRIEAREYTREHGDDLPEVRDWVWPGAKGWPSAARSLRPTLPGRQRIAPRLVFLKKHLRHG